MFGFEFLFPETELFSLLTSAVYWYSLGGLISRFMPSVAKAEKKNYILYANYSFNKVRSMF